MEQKAGATDGLSNSAAYGGIFCIFGNPIAKETKNQQKKAYSSPKPSYY
jgi:hypothetical protein